MEFLIPGQPDNLKIKIKKLHPDAIVPAYASSGAACFDLHALIPNNAPTQPALRTGLAFEVPAGHVMLIFSRSGHGFNHSVRLANCVGVIDSDYRGEVMVKLVQDYADSKPLVVRHGDRIAQAMLVPNPRVHFEVTSELADTDRGAGGFGSTGQ